MSISVHKDIGGIIPTSRAVENLLRGDVFDSVPIMSTGAAELMRANFIDALEFVADFHSLTKIKVRMLTVITSYII